MVVTVASLRLMSPRAATGGVTYLFREKTDDLFFCHRTLQSDDLFLAVACSPLPPYNVLSPVLFPNV